ncbi:MAG TPA: TIM-barrel domain-containing protein [Candidatus Acidoferrales bacterium]|nr:TIM-barrel domain-containing protein [Candidatus Acidoferrales bacterium]
MLEALTRRQILRLLGVSAAASFAGETFLYASARRITVAGRTVRVLVSSVTRHTVRITLAEETPAPAKVPDDGSLLENIPAAAPFTPSENGARLGDLHVHITEDPLTIRVESLDGRPIQELKVDSESGSLTFALGAAPVLGLGEGGPQFDRRGDNDNMHSGQGGYRLRTNGGRVPIQWLIGTSGWAMFIHRPPGSFDLSGSEGKFTPSSPSPFAPPSSTPPNPFPLDLFIVDAKNPAQAMSEYAHLTGHPEMPPLWALGYQQSHRTIANSEEILTVARTFREKKLPCDLLIYLGTGFTPSGWNSENGSFQFNPRVFPEPKKILDEFHSMHFKVALHVVILTRTLRGAAHDVCNLQRFDEEEVSCYWDAHRKVFALGVDGWWPDEGDPLDAASRLTRIRMYYEAPQIDRPNERPFALHRNGYAGMQRYAPFLWSGDVNSTWETLRTHVPTAINTCLSGIPLWGTDTGGFIPTKEFNGELFVRWFQFSAFCPLFRSHGRDWKLRLPWGWNTGDFGTPEVTNSGEVANPDPSELHNAAVEPICKKYLELRYRLLPYIYSAVREGHETGLPILRAMWLHYADDAAAVQRGDQYLWGRDILVAPVTEKGVTSRKVYLPQGDWYDFWTEEKIAGGREIGRDIDLATIPLYVRAGSVLPLGPVKQYTSEKVDEPMTIVIYPGTDGNYSLYEDDGVSFAYRRGEFMKTEMKWNDPDRKLTLRLATGSHMLPPARRKIEVRVAGETSTKAVEFSGQPITVQVGR